MRISDWSSDVCSSDLEDTADMTMALILSVPRRLAEGERVVRSGDWQGWAPTGMLGHRVNGKRLGIIGMGRIGSAVARRAKGFNMSIHYHNRRRVHPSLEEELEATYWESLDQMLRSEEQTSELQSLMRISYAVFCLKKKNKHTI